MPTEEELVSGSGVLQQPEQLEKRTTPRPDLVEVRNRFFIHFLRSMVRGSTSDQIYLSTYSAAKRSGLPREEAEIILQELMANAGADWPPGFM
jgi:hypothetical protein